MLFIKQVKNANEQQWRVGEPMPPISASVVTFHADGDELNILLAAIRQFSANPHAQQEAEEPHG